MERSVGIDITATAALAVAYAQIGDRAPSDEVEPCARAVTHSRAEPPCCPPASTQDLAGAADVSRSAGDFPVRYRPSRGADALPKD
jgi:hypothetical protein